MMENRRKIKGVIVLAAFALIAPCLLFGQEEYSDVPPWYISLNGGLIRFEGDEAVKDGFCGSLRLGYDYSPRWTFEGVLNCIPHMNANKVYNHEDGYPVPRNELSGDSAAAYGVAVDTLFHLLAIDNRRWDPYLLGGLGMLYFDTERTYRDRADATIRYGAGLAYHFNEEWAVRLDAIGILTIEHTECNFMPSAGVSWKWGAHVPKKFAVTGGAIDTDGDGLSDQEELALGTDPRNPDTDNDGLTDGEEVKKYLTDPLNPDTDYDALIDGSEVYDYKTNPLERDTDKGGVADGHEVIEDDTNPLDPSDDLLLFTLEIEFDTDKADLRPEYFSDLNIIGKVLSREPKSTARIEGHADKRKTSVAKYNKKLSERRAKAVLDYLNTKFGIARNRMAPVGYGFTRPKAPNDPITGNQKNRRVEVYIRTP